MAQYDIEILRAPRTLKAKTMIGNLAGINERDIDEKLQYLPFVIKSSLQLSEAIAIERDLKKLGIETRLIKVEVDDDADISFEQQPDDTPSVPVSVVSDDVIEIAEDDILVLHPYENIDQKSTVKRKRIGWGFSWTTLSIISLILIAIGLVSWYALFLSENKQTVVEIELSISQWQKTLQQQDQMLDKGFPPERIFYKLDELEGTIERLLTLVRPPAKAAAKRKEFTEMKEKSETLVKDLVFRQSLEDHGYPIHPTCMVDRGRVQGTSDLPESTLLRIKLYGENNIDSTYFAARISSGTFRLIIDPSIQNDVYDATATVAPFTQQPEMIKRWAERKFSLDSNVRRHLPGMKTLAPAIDEDLPVQEPPAQPGVGRYQNLRTDISMGDPGTDRLRVVEIDEDLTKWTEIVVASERCDLPNDNRLLEEIYLRLLDLEMRISQLLGLLESDDARNDWTEKREEIYGTFIVIRNEIDIMYKDQPKEKNPLTMETQIRRHFRKEGLTGSDVLVIDSPNHPGSFVIELEVTEGEKEDVFAAIAMTISREMRRSDLIIDHISLVYSGQKLRWTPEQILKAAEALNEDDGYQRCVNLMDINAEGHTMP